MNKQKIREQKQKWYKMRQKQINYLILELKLYKISTILLILILIFTNLI